MDRICANIKTFLEKYRLDNKKYTYLVAFSGGVDSMCLLDALKKTVPKNHIIAIHLNHGWRGEESDNEEKNCREFCKKIGVEIYCEKLPADIPHTETAAREARYQFFEKCCKNFNTNIVFTAHNRNDNAETVLYRMCMGTGISGLGGIASHRDCYYRPLLNIARDEIEKYCKKSKLNPNIDSSNYNTIYKRNYIRAEILPALAKINPDATDKINSLSENAREENEIMEEYLKLVLEKITDNNKIKTKKFFKLSLALQKRIIHNIYVSKNLDYDKSKIIYIINFLKENAHSKSGKTCSLTNNLWIFINSEYIEVIEKTKQIMPNLHILREGKYEYADYVFEIRKFERIVKKYPKENENIAYVNLSRFSFNFELRPRQNGDYITPFGMQGTQKLKKYLNSKKIPNHQKEHLLFLTQDKEILWAINLGISDKIKVEEKPTHCIKFYKKE